MEVDALVEMEVVGQGLAFSRGTNEGYSLIGPMLPGEGAVPW